MTRSARPLVHAHLDHGRSLETWQAKFRDGRVWEAFPYGYQHGRECYEMTYSTDRDERPVRRLFRLGVYWCLGFDLVHAWRNRRAIGRADVVWTHTEHEHLAVAFVLKVRRNKSTKLLAQSVWLWDEWQTYPRLKKWLYRWLLRRGGVHTTHSRLNMEIAQAELPGANVFLIPYGTEPITVVRQGQPQRISGIRVIAPGNDRDRDWQTLVESVRGEPDIELKIVSGRAKSKLSAGIDNVEIIRPAGVADLQRHYEWANVVAVPTRANLHASGTTVSLEALNAGLPVVVSRAGGIEDYFQDLVAYAEVGNPNSLRAALREAHSAGPQGAQGKIFVEARGLTARDYCARHILLTEMLLGHTAGSADVSQFSSLETVYDEARNK